MRRLVDALIACMLVGLLVGILHHSRRDRVEDDRIAEVRGALVRLREHALMHWAIAAPQRSGTTFPREPEAAWFGGPVPLNAAAPGTRPWLDIAPPDDILDHPPDPIITGREQAGFWYNPRYGLFRARVLPQATHDATLTLYNRLNDTALTSLQNEAPSARRPRTLTTMAEAPARAGSAPSTPAPIPTATSSVAAPPPAPDRGPGPVVTLRGAPEDDANTSSTPNGSRRTLRSLHRTDGSREPR